jgi:hypothetical protein
VRWYSLTAGSQTWTSGSAGQNDPGALDLEFDISLGLGEADNPTAANITIFGIPIQLISQAYNFTNKDLQLSAGYIPGLPLATLQAPHAGLILKGLIYPAYGNWVMNNLSLSFVVKAGGDGGQGGPTNPKNIVHNMPAGTPLSSAIQNTLSTAFQGSSVQVNISDKLKLSYPDWSFHQGFEQYANYIKALSHSILGTPSTSGYTGVRMTMQGNQIKVTDGTTKSPVTLIYEDIIGQPTWIGNNTIQVTTLLRSDVGPIAGGSGTPQIKLPASILTSYTAAGALPGGGGIDGNPGNDYLTFQGAWNVQKVRHVGRFRDPQWSAWTTIIEAIQDDNMSASPSTATPGNNAATTPMATPPGAESGLGPGSVPTETPNATDTPMPSAATNTGGQHTFQGLPTDVGTDAPGSAPADIFMRPQ